MKLGTPAEHSGIFGAAEQRAADIHGADRAMFSVHGSTGSNWIVLWMLALERPDAHVLIARNVHHSVINGLKAFGISFSFLPTPYDQRFEAFGAPNVQDVRQGLESHPEALAVLYTSPTYEGLGADTGAIAETVHAHHDRALVIVDEAWGAHLAFHPELPVPAMHAGADVCVQSTHKLGGSLQQTGLILWQEDRVDSEALERALSEYATTSPSFHLLASIEATLEHLLGEGEANLERALRRTDAFRAALARRVPALERFDQNGWLYERSRAAGRDGLKTTLALTRYGLSGYDLSAALLRQGMRPGVVVEKAGLNTIMLLTTFQLPEGVFEGTVGAIGEVLDTEGTEGDELGRLLPNPFDTLADDPLVDPYRVCREAKARGRIVALEAAVGEVAAEQVEVYPPGIPVILEGFPVAEGALAYLRETAKLGGSIVARDPRLETLRILPQR